jgi:hypothetical protein
MSWSLPLDDHDVDRALTNDRKPAVVASTEAAKSRSILPPPKRSRARWARSGKIVQALLTS